MESSHSREIRSRNASGRCKFFASKVVQQRQNGGAQPDSESALPWLLGPCVMGVRRRNHTSTVSRSLFQFVSRSEAQLPAQKMMHCLWNHWKPRHATQSTLRAQRVRVKDLPCVLRSS